MIFIYLDSKRNQLKRKRIGKSGKYYQRNNTLNRSLNLNKTGEMKGQKMIPK